MNSVNPLYYVALFGALLIGLYALYCHLRNTAQNGDDSPADVDITASTAMFCVLSYSRTAIAARAEWFTSEEEARERYNSWKPLSRAMHLCRVSWPAGGNDLRTFCRYIAGYVDEGLTSEQLCEYAQGDPT